MDYKLPNGFVINGIPDGTSEDEIKRIALMNGLAAEDDFVVDDAAPAIPPEDIAPIEEPVEPTIDENILGLANDIFLKGPMQATKGATDLVGMVLPESVAKPVSDFWNRGLEAAEWLKPDAYREAQQSGQFIKRDEEGNAIGVQVPSWQNVVGTAGASLAEIPTFIAGGQAVGKGLKAFQWLKKNPKIAEALGFGIVNAALVAPRQWRDTYDEAIGSGMSPEDANAAADTAALLTASISGMTGGAGAALAQKVGGEAANVYQAMMKGFLMEAPFEGIEEAGQSAAGDIGMGRDIDVSNMLDAGVLATMSGGLPGAAIGGYEQVNNPLADISKARQKELDLKARYYDEYYPRLQRITQKVYEETGEPVTDTKDWINKTLTSVGIDPDEYMKLWNEENYFVQLGDPFSASKYFETRKELEADAIGSGNVSEDMELLFEEKEDLNYSTMFDQILNGQEDAPIQGGTRILRQEDVEYEKSVEALYANIVKQQADIGLDKVGVKLQEALREMTVLPDGGIVEGIRPRRANEPDDIQNYDKEGRFVYDEGGFPRGFFDVGERKIFISTGIAFEKALKKQKSLDENEIDYDKLAKDYNNEVLSVLDHETIHALRNLDLFTKDEWDTLVKSAKKLMHPDAKQTYYEFAKEAYKELSEISIEEESVAELMRGTRNIVGKPRHVIGKVNNFFEKLNNSLTGSGFNSYQEVLDRVGSGALGSREPDTARTFAFSQRTHNAGLVVRESSKAIKENEERLAQLIKQRDPDGIGVIPDISGIGPLKAYADIAREYKDDPEIVRQVKKITKLYEKASSNLGIDLKKSFVGDVNMSPEQVAWHGSGNVFDRFLTDHIGEGEGMQVRGWGLYFGQQEQTGKHYFDMLGGKKWIFRGRTVPDQFMNKLLSKPEFRAARDFIESRDRSPDPDSYSFEKWAEMMQHQFSKEAIAQAKYMVDNGQLKRSDVGALYKVEIPDDVIDQMLDLDKKIADQPLKVKKIAAELGFNEQLGDFELTGEELRSELEIKLDEQGYDKKYKSAPEAAAHWLLERGITGNKFEDGWSRGKRREIWVDGVDYGGRNFEFPSNFTQQDENVVDRIFAGIENGTTTLDQAKEVSKKNGYKHILNFLNKTHVVEPEATYNYVVFDENDIDILTRNGEPLKPQGFVDSPQMSNVTSLQDKRKRNALKILNDARKKFSDKEWNDFTNDINQYDPDIIKRIGSKIPKSLQEDFDAYMEDYGEDAYAWENLAVHQQEFLEELASDNSPEMKRESLLAKHVLGMTDLRLVDEAPIEGEQGFASVDSPQMRRRGQHTPTYVPSFATPAPYSRGKRFIFEIQDKLIGLKDIEAQINEAREQRGLPPLTAKQSAYIGEELSFGRIGEAVRDFHENLVDPMGKTLVEEGIEIPDLDEFMVLRHAIERNERIRKVHPQLPYAGAGRLGDNELTDAFVKHEMLNKYGMRWDAATGEWRGGNAQGLAMKRFTETYVDPMLQGTLDEAVEGELINPDEHRILSKRTSLNPDGFYRYYTPLRGFGTDMMSEVAEDIANGGTSGTGGSISILGKQTTMAKGRTSEAYSPLATMIADRERTISRGVKNKEIGKRLFDLVEQYPNSDVWELIGPNNPRKDLTFSVNYRYVGNDPALQGKTVKTLAGVADKRNWVKQVLERKTKAINNPTSEELIGVKINGEQNYIDIKDKYLREALLNLDANTSSALVQAAGNVNRFLSFVNTTLNPEFVIGNFSRDIQTAVASIINEKYMEGGMLTELNTTSVTRKVVKDLPHAGRVFYREVRGKALSPSDKADIKEFLEAGAKADWFHSRPPEDQRANLEMIMEMAKGTFKGTAVQSMKSVIKFVEDGNAAVENAVRFSTFKVARDAFENQAGLSHEEAVERAASMAKNMTINFNRKGNMGNTLNSFYLFFNAQVQGTAVILRGVAESKVKRGIMGGITGMGLLMAMLHDMGTDDEEKQLEDVQDYIRERNMIIPAGIFGNEKDIMIPLPYGYNMFYQIGSNAYMSAKYVASDGKKGMSPQKASVEVVKTMLSSFNPLGSPSGESVAGNTLRMVAPTSFTPLIELYGNQNYFGKPIYKEDLPYGTPTPASHRSFKNTTEAFKWLTEGLNAATGGNESESGWMDIPPDAISYVIGYGLGGAGAFAERSFVRPVGRMKKGKAPFEEANDIPFVRRFIHDYTDKPDMGLFYDRRDRVNQKLNHVKNITDNTEWKDYYQKNKIIMQQKDLFDDAEKKLRVLRQQQRNIRDVMEKFPERTAEYSQTEERIQDEIDRILNAVNRIWDKQVGVD